MFSVLILCILLPLFQSIHALDIFGGVSPWSPTSWTSSDDRVRGGNSQSHLSIDPGCNTATFTGYLNTTALNGSAFTSQRTTSTNTTWYLSLYSGILFYIAQTDRKKYTLATKDELPEIDTASSLEWECNFVSNKTTQVFVGWNAFVPIYRGVEQNDVAPLNKTSIKRWSLMARSFSGEQEGVFELVVNRISAVESKSEIS